MKATDILKGLPNKAVEALETASAEQARLNREKEDRLFAELERFPAGAAGLKRRVS